MSYPEQYPEIITHLKSISKRYNKHSSGWIEIFCPWCDDAIRKTNPSHGHLYISPTNSFVHCFRCGAKSNLEKLLVDTNFKNNKILKLLKKTGNISYRSYKTIQSPKIDNIQKHIKTYNKSFPKDKFQQFQNYIYSRCLNINSTKFYLLPIFYQNQLMVQFLNSNGSIVGNRFISKSKRYLNSKERHLYFFQDINNIDKYDFITLAEGAFDIINLFNYCHYFNNDKTFYVAICGCDYKSTITTLITNYLMIGKYQINIVFDNGIQYLKQITHQILFTINELNCEIKIQFYLPLIAKDVSDVMLIKQIQSDQLSSYKNQEIHGDSLS